MQSVVRTLCSIVILIVFVVLAWDRVDFRPLASLSALNLISILAPVVLFTLMRTYVFSIALRPFDVRLDFREWFGLGVYASILNLILPFRSGLSIKAIYLKRRHTFGFSHFVGMQGALSLIQLFTMLVVGVVILYFVSPDWIIIAPPLVIAVAMPTAAILLRDHKWRGKSKILLAVSNMYHSFYEVVRSERGVVWRIMVNSLLVLSFNCIALYAALSALGVNNGFAIAVSIAIASMLINLVTITPGNFGLLEFSAGYISGFLESGFNDGFLATLVVRAVSIAFLIGSAPFFFGLVRDLGREAAD